MQAEMRTFALVSWFRNSLHHCRELLKRISEPYDTRIIDLLVSFESEVRSPRVRQSRANFGFGTLACVLLASAGPAGAFTTYVSNEKSNTITVIDTDKLQVVNTFKVGQRPRGIELTRDGKFVLVAVGDDDTIEVVDVKSGEVVTKLPSGPDPELFTQDSSG